MSRFMPSMRVAALSALRAWRCPDQERTEDRNFSSRPRLMGSSSSPVTSASAASRSSSVSARAAAATARAAFGLSDASWRATSSASAGSSHGRVAARARSVRAGHWSPARRWPATRSPPATHVVDTGDLDGETAEIGRTSRPRSARRRRRRRAARSIEVDRGLGVVDVAGSGSITGSAAYLDDVRVETTSLRADARRSRRGRARPGP